jgi:hypothetical protein
MKNNNILFISPEFFGYEKLIISKLINLGFNVTFLKDRPFRSIFFKFLSKYTPYFIYLILDARYKKELNDKVFDFIFIINGQTISSEIYKFLNISSPNSLRVLYLWDSIYNRKNSLLNRDFFTKVFSFDEYDSFEYNLTFRPLFFSYVNDNSFNNEYDFAFIGTIHSDRFKILNNIFKHLYKYQNFKFFYLQSKFLFYIYKIFNINFFNAKISDFNFHKLNYNEVISLLKSSKVIIDVEHPLQSGLTIRTIEAVGLGKKIITTNKNIIKYDFYHPNNILVIDRASLFVPDEFIKSEYVKINNNILNYYSIDFWLNDVLFFNNK